MMTQIDVLLRVAGVLDEMQIPYFVVGSVASSIHGFSRATADVDIVADLRPENVSPLYTALKDECYVDEQAMRRAISLRRMFNLIHLDTMFKVDIYVTKDDEFSRQQFKMARRETLLPGEAGDVYISAPEETIPAKLRRHRRGGEVSERQLSDVLGVLKVQRERLDLEYLREWAVRLEVLDLLERLLVEAGLT
jgi:hypothetical protein